MPAGASACTREAAPTSLIFPLSISTAAGESTFPVRGSSRRAALTRVTEAGVWAASCPTDNRTNDIAKSKKGLRMRLNGLRKNNCLILPIMALDRIKEFLSFIADRLRSCQKQPARRDEGTLQIHASAKQNGCACLICFVAGSITSVEIGFAHRWCHSLQHCGPRQGPAFHRCIDRGRQRGARQR